MKIQLGGTIVTKNGTGVITSYNKANKNNDTDWVVITYGYKNKVYAESLNLPLTPTTMKPNYIKQQWLYKRTALKHTLASNGKRQLTLRRKYYLQDKRGLIL